MQEVYPQSRIWPFVTTGLLLIGLALAPPPRWPQAFRDIHDLSVAIFKEEQKPEPTEPLIIAYDPAIEACKLPLTTAADTETGFAQELMTPLVGGVTSGGIDAAPSDASLRMAARDVAQYASPDVSETSDVMSMPYQSESYVAQNLVSDSTKRKRVHVWQPPTDWIARPFQPLDVATRESPKPQQASTHVASQAQRPRATAMDMANTVNSDPFAAFEMTPIEPPVANRITRSDRLRQQSQPNVDHSAIHPQSLSDQVPAESQLIELDSLPAHDDISPEDPGNKSQPEYAEPKNTDPETVEPGNLLVDQSGEGIHPDPWPEATKLHELLEYAYEDRVLKNWAFEIRKHLKVLEGFRLSGAAEQVNAVNALKDLATVEVDRSRWPLHHRVLHDRVRASVLRRIDVWEPLMKVAHIEPSSFAKYRAQQQLAKVAGEVEQRLQNDPHTAAWAEYLMLSKVRQLPYAHHLASSAEHRLDEIAYSILTRMRSPKLDASQQAFLSTTEFRELEAALRHAIGKSIHPADLMQAIEEYELNSNRESADRVIAMMMRLRTAPQGQVYSDSIDAITKNYRNANLRVAVSEDLINRLIPAFHQYAESVTDTILGAQVRGKNSTLTNLSMRLIPDPDAIRIGLFANGRVQSNTASRKGPVTMFNRGTSNFTAGKHVIVRPNGIQVTRTTTRAATGNRVVGLRTELDDVPLIGWFVRYLARQEHAEQKPFLRQEVLRRVHRSTSEKMDLAVNRRVATAERNIGDRVVAPLRQMDLDPRAMEMRTTSDRAIIRARLASSTQFGSHTPRPQARADSLMSMQIHQTAANNLIEQLNLHGKRMTLEELTTRLSQRFGITLEIKNDDYKQAIIQFADHHPMEFEFEDGQITLTIHLAELKTGKRRWKNFSARGYYRADVRKLDVELIRDEGIELLSDRLKLRDQLALRSIFTKVFTKNTRIEMLSKAIQQQPRLQSLVVSQFTIRDGWMAIAFGEDDQGMRLVEKTGVSQR